RRLTSASTFVYHSIHPKRRSRIEPGSSTVFCASRARSSWSTPKAVDTPRSSGEPSCSRQRARSIRVKRPAVPRRPQAAMPTPAAAPPGWGAPSTSGSPSLAAETKAEAAQGDRGDQEQPLEEELRVGGDADESEAVEAGADRDHANQCADDVELALAHDRRA